MGAPCPASALYLVSDILVGSVMLALCHRVRPGVHIRTNPSYFMQSWYLSWIVIYGLFLIVFYWVPCWSVRWIPPLLFIYLFSFCGASALFRSMAVPLPGCQDSWASLGEVASPTPSPHLSLSLSRTSLKTCLVWMALPAARFPPAYFTTPIPYFA
jgi:hypothetical protein